MADRARIPLWLGRRHASEIIGLLAPFCERIAVAGSIRRAKETVGDVELVAIPRIATETVAADMFSTREETTDLLDHACRGFRRDGAFADRPDVNGRPAFGSKFKRLLYRDFPLDLFVTSPECWGCIYLIRTGPAEFGKQLVLKASEGGWLPRGFFFRDGRLWKLPPPYDASLVDLAKPLDTPEEADVFAALGYEFVPPEQRGTQRPRVLSGVAR